MTRLNCSTMVSLSVRRYFMMPRKMRSMTPRRAKRSERHATCSATFGQLDGVDVAAAEAAGSTVACCVTEQSPRSPSDAGTSGSRWSWYFQKLSGSSARPGGELRFVASARTQSSTCARRLTPPPPPPSSVGCIVFSNCIGVVMKGRGVP